MNVGVGDTLFNLPAPSQQQNDKACRSSLEKPQQSQGMGGSGRWGWGVGLAKHHRREEEEQEERDRGMQTRGGTARVGGHPGAESVAGGRRSEPPERPCRWHEPHRPLSPPQRDFAFQLQASAAARKAPLRGEPRLFTSHRAADGAEAAPAGPPAPRDAHAQTRPQGRSPVITLSRQSMVST